jgi:hypothetical protein
MKRLGSITPTQPSKGEPNENIAVTCEFAATDVKYIKVVAKPLAKLPKWHPGKGEKAWIFIDEVLVN